MLARPTQTETSPNLLERKNAMRGPSLKTIELILFARSLLEQFRPMTLRQLHYAIFSAAVIAYANTKADYKRLSRATTDARRLYRQYELIDDIGHAPRYTFPGGWIVDETREAEMVSVWDDVDAYKQGNYSEIRSIPRL
jgi:hypothetical protein